jgi:hypothetical protein
MRSKSISKKARNAATSPRESHLDEWQFPVDSFCPPDAEDEDEITTKSSQLLNAPMPILGSMVHG